MKYMMTYDWMESVRNTNQWLGATAHALAEYPMLPVSMNPAMDWIRAWGQVTERTFRRMIVKPDWNIPPMKGETGKESPVVIETLIERPFGDLIHFSIPARQPKKRRVLLVAPMSGHYATLLRKTVFSLLKDCEVYVTDWHNARDIPVSEGKFDVEDYTLYLVDFMKELGTDIHVIAVCQPVPLALAATAYLAEEHPEAQPKSLTLIGGPVDPEANHTEVTDFGRSVTMGQLEETMIQRVGFKYAGVGRMVYPGLLQLASFISMNAEMHANAFRDQIIRTAKGEASEHDKHNAFYDEYLAVMDMTAEFYLSTVELIFKGREIARNVFEVAGRKVDIGKITNVAVKTVEGEEDDISAPGQCRAALDLLTGLPDDKKAAHVEPGAGHYGIFAGSSWRNNIRPLVLDFIDANSDPAEPVKVAPAAKPASKRKAAVAKKATTAKITTEKKPAAKKPAPKAEAAAKPAAKKATTKAAVSTKPAAKKAAPKAETTAKAPPKKAAPKAPPKAKAAKPAAKKPDLRVVETSPPPAPKTARARKAAANAKSAKS